MPEKKKAEGFTFTHGDETHSLPPASEAAARVPGKFMQDAIMETDDAAEVRLRIAMLNASGATPEALDALREMPASEMMDIVLRWMGESRASSD